MAATLPERLRILLSSVNWTQGDLGSRLNISQSAISQWLTGTKSPSSENLARIAATLGASQTWLETGEGEPPFALVERARESYAEVLEWGFRPEPEDGARDYGNANLWSLPWDIDTLVREAVQNILDVPLDSQRAETEFRIIRLAGAALDDFLTALKWDEPNGLKSHIEAAANSHQKLSAVLRNGLSHLQRNKELLLLCVEDRGTIGLIGDEIGEGNFAALTRNNLDSSKQRGTAGGSYGLGKAVFWRASQFATVLFHSRLSQPVDVNGEPRDIGRFIGRVELPWHQVNDSNFAGPGWYGRSTETGKRISSVWNQQTLLNDLHLGRESTLTGTSIMVVGFNDASSDKPKDMEELRNDISRAIALNFWPALYSGRLTAHVSTWDGRVLRSRSQVDVESHQRTFVDCLRRFKEDEINDRLTNDGDVVARPIPLDVPKRMVSPDKHGPMRQEATLIVRRDSEDDLDDLSSHLAVYRGREMVITYISLKHVIPGSTPFRAILLCGEAAGSSDADRAAERFLRTAEPPAHNEWKSTPELKAEYAWGANARIRSMLDDAKRAIRDLVRPAPEDLDDGPRELKELLKLSGPPDKQLFPKISRQQGAITREGNEDVWSILIGVRPPDSKPWRIQPILKFAVESGGDKPVPWILEAIERCSVTSDGWVNIPPGMREAVFRGKSDPSGHPVPPHEAAVTVSIRSAERTQGGSR